MVVRDPMTYVLPAPFLPYAPDRDVAQLTPCLPRPRMVADDFGRRCRTYLPIRPGAETTFFLQHAFEEESRFPGLFVPWADALTEEPCSTSARITPVPPGHLLTTGETCLLRASLWQWSSFKYVNGVMTRDPDLDTSLWATPRQWRSRLRGGNEFRWRLSPKNSLTEEDALDSLGLGRVTMERALDYAWELDTFLFRLDFERLTAFKHRALNALPLSDRPRAWVPLRDRVRRIWGLDLNYFPSVREPAYLDSEDELLRLRHWRAVGRIMMEWEVPDIFCTRIQVAMGGTVTEIENGLKAVFKDVHKQVYNRDPYPFEHRRIRLA